MPAARTAPPRPAAPRRAAPFAPSPRPGRDAARVAAAALALALAHCPARADGTVLTVSGGWRGGGGFTEAATGASRRLEPSAVLSASLERPLDASRQLQLHLSHQDTTLVGADPQAAAGATPRLPLRITSVHVGGTNFFDGPVGRGPYVVGGVGATFMSPGLAGTSTEAFLSLSLGVGWVLPLTPSLALRAEVRAHLVAVEGRGALFCSGGCVVSLRGDGFAQADAQVGLALRF